jgi:hypothetical protein
MSVYAARKGTWRHFLRCHNVLEVEYPVIGGTPSLPTPRMHAIRLGEFVTHMRLSHSCVDGTRGLPVLPLSHNDIPTAAIHDVTRQEMLNET